jgi:hypothetical protein
MVSENEKENKEQIDYFEPIGSTGLKQASGFVYEELFTKLQGERGVKYYTEMINNSSTIGAIRYTIQSLVRQVEHWIAPSDSSSQEAIAHANFVTECVGDMTHTFEDFISQSLTFLDFGWALFEITYKMRRGENKDPRIASQYSDGKIGWRSLDIRAQDTLYSWEFSKQNDILGMNQMDTYSGLRAFIPIEKAVLFRTESTKNNPEGRSIYRSSVFDWYFFKKISEIEGIGIERDMTGLLTMQVPLQLLSSQADANSKAIRAQLEKMLSELKRDEREYAMVPSELDGEAKPTGYKLSLLSTGGSRQIDTSRVKQEYKNGMLQSVLAQFIQLGMQGAGSFALASSQTDLFAVALGNFLSIIASTFNKSVIGPLMELNKVPKDLWPKLVFGDIEQPELDVLGQYVQVLAASGILPIDDEGLRDKLLSYADLPLPGSTTTQKSCGCGEVHKSKKAKMRGSAIAQLKKYYKPVVK